VQGKPFPLWLGIAILMVIAVTFGSNHIAARVAFDHGVNVITAVVFRSSGTALVVLALLLAMRAPLRLSAPKFWRAAGIGVVLGVQSYCLYSSVRLLPVALALLAFNTFPMIFSLMSWAAGVERLSRTALIAMPVALAGLALALDVLGASGEVATRWTEIGAGVAYATGASVCFAFALFLIARWLPGVDGKLGSCLTMGTVGVVAFAGAAVTGTFALPTDGAGWLGVVLLTLFYGAAITALFVVQPHLRASSDVAALNFEPIALLFMGWAILGQAVGPLQIFGALVVIGAIVALGMAKR
jgi:drug/metabolite transporter (DMT)-like permease